MFCENLKKAYGLNINNKPKYIIHIPELILLLNNMDLKTDLFPFSKNELFLNEFKTLHLCSNLNNLIIYLNLPNLGNDEALLYFDYLLENLNNGQ